MERLGVEVLSGCTWAVREGWPSLIEGFPDSCQPGASEAPKKMIVA